MAIIIRTIYIRKIWVYSPFNSFFYLLGFKTISPDITNLTKTIGDGKIILTSDKLIPKLDLLWACLSEYDISSGNLDDYEDGSPDEKLEIE